MRRFFLPFFADASRIGIVERFAIDILRVAWQV